MLSFYFILFYLDTKMVHEKIFIETPNTSKLLMKNFIVSIVCLSVLVCAVIGRQRIAGGSPATLGQFPYAVFVQITKPSGSYDCVGTLISTSTVLTAAHCVTDFGDDAIQIQVVYGYLNNTVVPTRNLGDISAYSYHQDYLPSTVVNDIALLHFNTPVVLSQNVKLAAVATTAPTLGGSYFAAGWGTTESGQPSPILLYTELTVAADSLCEAQEATNGFPYEATTQFCMNGGSPTDTCEGDSGGGIAQKDTAGDWTVYGIVSYGPSACGAGNGVVATYTKVSFYQDWIAANEANLDLQPVATASPTTGMVMATKIDGVGPSAPTPTSSSITIVPSETLSPVSSTTPSSSLPASSETPSSVSPTTLPTTSGAVVVTTTRAPSNTTATTRAAVTTTTTSGPVRSPSSATRMQTTFGLLTFCLLIVLLVQ
jgi:secreted trypsin-like serine protease